MRILVMDGDLRSALAATRSLGRAGHEIVVASASGRSLAGASRHASKELTCPSPYDEVDQFLSWAQSELCGGRHDAVLPMSEVTTDLIIRFRDRWPDIVVPFPAVETIDFLSDKVNLHRQAERLGVPVPRSVVAETRDDLADAADGIGFPAVIKPRRSRVLQDNGFESTAVVHVSDAESLARARDELGDHAFPCLYQEKVGGVGAGLFALYDRGRPIAWFAHRRIREKPPEGGVSVYCESVAIDPELKAMAESLLGCVDWHGVAMVEFKVSDRDGPYLMEINARFWGSLQLSIDAGIDFPRLLFDSDAASGSHQSNYRTGRRIRWFLGDLDRLYIVSKRTRQHGLGHTAAEWLKFFVPHIFSTRHEVFRWSDPKPAFRELRDYIGALVSGD